MDMNITFLFCHNVSSSRVDRCLVVGPVAYVKRRKRKGTNESEHKTYLMSSAGRRTRTRTLPSPLPNEQDEASYEGRAQKSGDSPRFAINTC